MRSGHPPIILPWNLFHLAADIFLFFPRDPPPPTTDSAPEREPTPTPEREHVAGMWKVCIYLFFLVIPTWSAMDPTLLPRGGIALKIFVLNTDCMISLWAPQTQLDAICAPSTDSDSASASDHGTHQLDTELCSLLRAVHSGGPSGRPYFYLLWKHYRLTPRGGVTTRHHLLQAHHLCTLVAPLPLPPLSSLNDTAVAAHASANAARAVIWNALTFRLLTTPSRLGGRHVTALDCAGVSLHAHVAQRSSPFTVSPTQQLHGNRHPGKEAVNAVPGIWQFQSVPLALTVYNEMANATAHVFTYADGRYSSYQ